MMLKKELLLQQNAMSNLYRITVGNNGGTYGYGQSSFGELSPVYFDEKVILDLYNGEGADIYFYIGFFSRNPDDFRYPVRVTRLDTNKSILLNHKVKHGLQVSISARFFNSSDVGKIINLSIEYDESKSFV